MEPVDNNQFEVVPTQKRKVPIPCPNVYLNPALDLLANEDPMCNTAMEIVPNKKRKRSKSCDIIAFENSALDLGISKAAVNEFLAKELENVKRNIRYCVSEPSTSLHRNVDDTIQSDTDIFDPKIEIIEPTISIKKYSDPNISAMSCNLTINSPAQVFETANMDIGLKTAITEPVYANLTEVEEQMQVPCVTIPSSNMFEVQTTNIDANHIETIDQDLSSIPKELHINNTSMQDCMDISKIDNVTDSGISVFEQKSSSTTNLENNDLSTINNTNIQTNITNQIFVNNTSNLSLSFLDRLALDSPNMSNQSLILDDDLNESNIMEIKTITIITKRKRISDKKKNTNPFLDSELTKNLEEPINITAKNPFFHTNEINNELEYNEEMVNRPVQATVTPANTLMPRRLFTSDVNSTISTVNESVDHDQHEYENIDSYRAESPIYENIGEIYDGPYNKQSKILGCDVSQFSAIDIMNINKNSRANSSNESSESKKDSKHKFLKTLRPKKMFKTLKKTFRGEKHAANQTLEHNVTLNPYEIPRKLPKDKLIVKDTSGIENPALNLDTSDIEIEEIDEYDDDEEHQYETVKTLRNTQLNMNVTPLRERNTENNDISHNKTNTPGKKVRFDSTLNQEKVITGNSFDYDLQSPGFDAKIDKYHDELENCINERKFLQQNM